VKPAEYCGYRHPNAVYGMARANLLLHERIDYDDGMIVELVLWHVPTPVPPSITA